MLGFPTSPLLTSLLLLMVRPDLESITFPELSIIRVLAPDVPSLFKDELLLVSADLLYVPADLPLSLDLAKLLLFAPLVRPPTPDTVDLPLFEVLYVPVLLPDLLLAIPE